MSYAARKNRTESPDAQKLRAEYENLARRSREDGASAKVRDEKAKAFAKLVDHINGERAEKMSEVHKVLIGMGRLKSEEQVKREREAAEAQRNVRVKKEG